MQYTSIPNYIALVWFDIFRFLITESKIYISFLQNLHQFLHQHNQPFRQQTLL